MKILFEMTSSFSNPSTSGHLMEAIIVRLAEQGHDVHVLQMLKPDDDLILPDTLKEYNIKTDGVRVKPQKKNNYVARYLYALKHCYLYKRILIEQNDADAIFIQSTNAAGLTVWMARRYLKKAVVTFNVQDIFPYNLMYSGKLKRNSILFKGLAAIQRYGYQNADHVITISEDMKDTLVKDGTDAQKIDVIYNWSYQDKLYEETNIVPIENMFDRKFFNVVYAGNIGALQNVELLVKSAYLMKEDKSVWFHIIGNGVNKEKVEKAAKGYGIVNISFWPMQNPAFAPAIYSSADVNIIPLAKDVYRTALPSKTATCLACQKPIIFAIGKDSEFGKKARDEAGCLLIDPDDPKELVSAILKVKKGEYKNNAGEFFLKYCKITENSGRYAEIIVR